jgi:hypothetical protein
MPGTLFAARFGKETNAYGNFEGVDAARTEHTARMTGFPGRVHRKINHPLFWRVMLAGGFGGGIN